MTERWIVVRNWERFQHPDVLRADSAPPWIRAYTKLLHNPDFESLGWHLRGILLTIWLEFASSGGQLLVTAVSSPCQPRVRRSQLEALREAGFIDLVASRPQALRLQDASLDKTRQEKKDQGKSSTSREDRNDLPFQNDLPFEQQLAETRLLAAIGGNTNGTTTAALKKYRLPPAAWYAAAAELERKGDVRNRAGYVVGMFKTWANEGRYT